MKNVVKRKGIIPTNRRLKLAEETTMGIWEYGHIVNDCTKHEDVHSEECGGHCKKIPAPKSVVDLHNEVIEWDKRGMVIQGVPAALGGGPFPGISVEIFEIEMRFSGLIKYLAAEWDEFDEEKASDYYRKEMVTKLKGTREMYDKAKAQGDITIAQPPLLGPNGEVLH